MYGSGTIVGMRPIPLTLVQANDLVKRLHRHHFPVVGHRFSIGLQHEGRLVGAVIVGRPVARKIDQYSVAEVTRLVTDGTPHACSALYGAAARAAKAMGFDAIQTYILDSEPGSSLKGAGWSLDGETKGRDWNTPARGGCRTDQPMQNKQRWVLRFTHPEPFVRPPMVEATGAPSTPAMF